MRIPIAVACLAALSACTPPVSSPSPAADGVPGVRREFRAVWVATVANIDYPSRPGLPVDSQRAELTAVLDRAAALHLNAIVFQIRPAGDALYPSQLEPWSEYLTGEQGRAPEGGWDPLAFAVAEAHRRGMQLHAWFNPYRASHPTEKTPPAASHISRTHPEVVKQYGHYLWMDPGEPLVQDHSIAVILDVVRRYDVDGVHIDDYFYPYPEKDSAGATIDFPDEPSWQRYRASGGRLSRDDWRRSNVDRFVERMYREVHRAKPWVQVGISPFGIWRPGNPPQIVTSFDQYAVIYADARRWLREGWADYFSPQLYWRIAATGQSYPVLLDWWERENVRGRQLWPGNFTSRTFEGDPQPWPASEVIGQIYVTRGRLGGGTGNVHFSMKAFALNRDSLSERLVREAYRDRALPPASPWLARGRPARPALALARDASGVQAVSIRAGGGAAPMWWAVRARAQDRWTTDVLPAAQTTWTLPPGTDQAAVSAVDRVGVEGPVAVLRVSP
ncbi:glycoside hydrolase family 10 protein [Longimicrobium sp.]|uniref:glycoside hydrolase family 10 protein n=1 Tax=Longimicrobium sp. TaxID=2029185 RepID=UPI002CAD6648|nr:family 10 glycosylhydrolase [Longimicrobium sp.]HSU15999.1 family 10 glycosylhydrolase [Longimicrobium sp.]